MRLKELRDQRGLNMRQMSIALNVPYTTYISWEKGERQPNSEMLVILARYFGCTVDYLIGLSDEYNAQYKMPGTVPEPSEEEGKKETAPIKTTWDGIENKLSGLSDNELDEVETFLDFLLYKRDHSSDD